MKTLKNLILRNKKKALFVGSFAVCPCPVHGTLLGLSLVGATAVIEKLRKGKKTDGTASHTI
jgi:hypothetical protein